MLDTSLLLPEKPRKLRRVEYDQLVAAGAFDDERVELLHGVLVAMSPHGPDHANAVDRLTEMLVAAVGSRARVRIQQPIVADDESEPEPDVAVVPSGDYRKAHPSAALLVIEVSSSSLKKDRRVKAPLYAASGFQEYWIVDTLQQAVEVHRAPSPAGYGQVNTVRRGDTLSIEAFADVRIAVDDIFA